MPPQRAIKGHPIFHNIEEQGLPNAPEVQPQGEILNFKLREAIRMLTHAITNKCWHQS